ncbi:methionyl-tRNA formyltransferase [Candidatus Daviesbacteria bacterium]|nr:methionyl-tRNA formyltransferase [Candidatus Daviesbacteria bacterium]
MTKLIFFGNTKYSIIGAKVIHKTFPLSAVVTIPDKIIGRKKEVVLSPVKKFAILHNIPVIETNKLTDEVVDKIKYLNPDFLVVEDYGLILPLKLLEIPKIAPLNIHHSLLPKYRGPSPVPSAILNGEKLSGVTIIRMTKDIDAGDILAQKEYTLIPNETTDSLLTTLNSMGGELLVDVINQYLQGTTTPQAQNKDKATLTRLIKKEDGYFDIENPPDSEQLDRMIRAYFPWPNVWTKWKGKVVKFYPSPNHPDSASAGEGSILVQMEGKQKTPLKDFLNGYPNFPIKKI